MFIMETILAAALLSGSGGPELQNPALLQAFFPALRYPLMGLAVEHEILDSRETRYVLTRAEDFPGDLQMLQRRYQELTDAPGLADAFRFPDRTVVNELLVFNRAYRNFVELRQPMEMAHWGELRSTQREIDHLYHIWDTVRDARCEYYYVTVRRQALKRLRELIGDDAYYSGELPPHVPLWRFQLLD